MGILSANNLPCSNEIHTYDFSSDSSQVYGGSAGYKLLENGIWGMAGGDANSNGLIDDSDILQWTVNAGNNNYLLSDFNLDGQVNNKDKYIWQWNISYIIQVPE